jgi:hypothetical protein
VQPEEIGHDGDLEFAAALEATLKDGRYWDRFGRDHQVVLGSNRTLLR